MPLMCLRITDLLLPPCLQLDVYLLDKAAAAVRIQSATAAYFAAWAGYSLVTGASSAIIGSVTYAQAAVYGPSYCQVGFMQQVESWAFLLSHICSSMQVQLHMAGNNALVISNCKPHPQL
jgi:hypothetical protein